ncbi:hypothetical protein [Mucilaginibacter sp. UR6-11]|uniref:hypothetical protein n=1 Tax=Mucilaginibacter sp. UR6-11 TaxID=1435644 RepID=UPI001E4CC743|nr:hypothetical protein [Mucilaginibacter sp. UR6-11]MCC8425203.1 hypothetical protein [Mucilaginibacter sp. UR6-11]
MEPKVELAKTRDFGEIIADSFLFIRQNLKPLVSCFFLFCGFFLLISAVFGMMQQLRLTEMINSMDSSDGGATAVTRGFGRKTFLETSVMIIAMLLTYTAMPVTILSFMTLYKDKGNVAPTNEEVWGYFKYYFFKVLGGSIVNAIVLICGFILCLIPGIYFYPVLGLIFPIMIVEHTTYGYAFNQSFRLIKDKWWTVFGALFITWLIVAVCSSIITMPFAAVNIWSTFLQHTRHVHLSVLSIVSATILGQLAHVLYILPLVALTLCYFSLTESKHATGLMDRIDQIGLDNTDTDTPAEEY